MHTGVTVVVFQFVIVTCAFIFRHHIAEQIANATETEVTQCATVSSNTPPSAAHRLSAASPPPGLRRVSQENQRAIQQNIDR